MHIKPQTSKIKNRAGVIDVIAQDSNTGEAVLVMNEPEPWDDSDERCSRYKERFNAYFRFCSMAKWRRRILNSPTGQPGSSCVALTCPTRAPSSCSA